MGLHSQLIANGLAGLVSKYPGGTLEGLRNDWLKTSPLFPSGFLRRSANIITMASQVCCLRILFEVFELTIVQIPFSGQRYMNFATSFDPTTQQE
jgi:hypothetical protein